MEPWQGDTKRQVEFEINEAGRDAKRLCQHPETLVQPSTDLSTSYEFAAWEPQSQGWSETERAALDNDSLVMLPAIDELAFNNQSFRLQDHGSNEHRKKFPVFDLFQNTEGDTPLAGVSPGCSTPSAFADYGDSVEQLKFGHGSGSHFKIPTSTSCSESDNAIYSTSREIVDQKESLSGICTNIKEWGQSSISSHHGQFHDNTAIVNNQVELEPINTNAATYSSSAAAADSNSYHEVGYDTCFGVIVAKPVCSTIEDKQASAPVVIKRSGGILKLYLEESSKYAGLLKMPGLCSLLDGFEVKFKAFLIPSKPDRTTKDTKRKKDKGDGSLGCSIRILVYGLMSERDAVGNHLSEADLHLQQPQATEYNLISDYSNPHYLIRPGGRMPRLEDLYLDSDSQGEEQPIRLGETKNHLLRIFDSADGLSASATVVTSPRLRSNLMDHQQTALAMMIEKECGIVDHPKFPSLWVRTPDFKVASEYRHIITGARNSSPKPMNGGILADDMGLGKTLSMLALICSSLDASNSLAKTSTSQGTKTTLIVTPKSTLTGWEQQIARHINVNQVKAYVYHGSNRQRLSKELNNFDIVFTTYETLRSDFHNKGPLYSVLWFRLVLDEAHHIRNRSSQVFSATCGLRALYRWCLTGTPIQNSLDDYGALLSFLDVHPFREKSQFDHWIVSCMNMSKHDSTQNLRSLVNATCLRRTKRTANMNINLPDRNERIECVNLSQHDQKLYDFFKGKIEKITSGAPEKRKSSHLDKSEGNILALITILRLICNHGEDLLSPWASKAWRYQSDSAVDWSIIRCSRQICNRCGEDMDMPELLDSPSSEESKRYCICDSCAQIEDIDDSRSESPLMTVETSVEIQLPTLVTHPAANSRPSAKVDALLKNLLTEQKTENSKTQPKSVVFTSWTKMLDLIESAVKIRGFDYERLDGQTSLKSRGERIKRFNEDSHCTVMLATIGSTGEGVDFTAANHIHLVEPHWNPMAEAQAVDRVHRIGQVKPVMVTRYIVPESIETYVQWIQEEKLRLINQSINDTDSETDNRSQILQNLQKFLSFVNKI